MKKKRKHRYQLLRDACLMCGLPRAVIVDKRYGCYGWVARVTHHDLLGAIVDDLGARIGPKIAALKRDFLDLVQRAHESGA